MTGENYMWISEEKTLSDLEVAAKDLSISCLYFVHVDFTDEIVEALRGLNGRWFQKLGLMTCRGQLDVAISLLLSGDIHLESLRLDSLHFKPNTATALGNGLARSKSLKYLSLQAMCMNECLSKAIQFGLSETTSLETLMWNTIRGSIPVQRPSSAAPKKNPPWTQHVLAGIQSNNSLKRLVIYRVNDLCTEQLLKTIQAHSSLLHLTLTLVDLNNLTVNAITELSRSSQSKLRTLKLCIRGEWYDIYHLPSRGRIKLSLELSIKPCDKRLALLGRTLAENDQIESLCLGHNGLIDKHIVALSPWLAKAKGLKYLNLHGNCFKKKGGQALLLSLQSNYHLENLQLPARSEDSIEIGHYVDLNKGGRKLLLDTHAPASLWSLAIERADRIDYSRYSLLSNSKDNDRRRANVIFHLLQGPATLH